ncbi:MAG: T9SS type A sorting domain-containing protein [Bacteroidota bacterium]
MKHLVTFISALAIAGALSGQHLVTGNSDVIGLTGWPYYCQMVEAGPNNFYWIGGTYHTSVDHPLLDGVDGEFANIYFIRYNEKGDHQYANYIRGSYIPNNAFSFDGGITLAGSAFENVQTNTGVVIPINEGYEIEFLARYNDRCQFENIVSIWYPAPSQSVNSTFQMDKSTGDLYVAGTSNHPLSVAGHGEIGADLQEYLYVLRYDRNLALSGVFTAGMEPEGEYGYYRNITVVPDQMGNVIITGVYEGDRAPVIGATTLTGMMMEMDGLFAFKLDKDFTLEWVQEGNLGGMDYYYTSQIYKGLPLRSGDVIMTGVTTTGYFKLGGVEISFKNGDGYSNQIAFSMAQDGSVRWIRPLQNMAETYQIGKKGTLSVPRKREIESEQFSEYIDWDAIQWNDEILYLTSGFMSDSFRVAGKFLDKPYYNGIFVAALDINSGDELWGYALSSSNMNIHGFDVDGSGNVSLMGTTDYLKDLDGVGTDSVPGTRPIFHLGLKYDGTLLWYNNASLPSGGYGAYGADLQVLRDGEVFSSMYKSVADPLLIGGQLITSQDSYTAVLASLDVNNELGGTLLTKAGLPVFPGQVIAYLSTASGAYPVANTVDVNDDGVFLFEGLYPGDYIMMATPDKIQYPDGIPTYSGGAISWDEAKEVVIEAETKFKSLYINLSEIPRLTEADGSGQMSGNVSYADEFDTRSFKGTKGEPVTKTSVILVRKKTQQKSTLEEDIVAYVETDDLGNYVFDNVPDGTYTLIVDVPGLPMIQTYEVEILANKIVSGLDFFLRKKGIDTSGTVDIKTVSMGKFTLFPNPGSGLLNIECTASRDYTVQVYNMVGNLVESREFPSAAGLLYMDISELHTGMYLIKIEGDHGVETVKYLKK